MIKAKFLLFCILLISQKLYAQDKSDTLTFSTYIDIIKNYHPVAEKARLLEKLARAKKLKAWGGFDPKIEADYDRKIYDGTEYFQFLTPEVKMPLWYGLELKGSYSEAEGDFVNPENKLPKEGLSYAGLSIQLGRGLFMDERRAALRQAQIFERASENEQIIMLNDLFMDAGENYIEWQNAFLNIKVYEDALQLSKIRFEAVKTGFIQGDKPSIDTVEALIQVNQRVMALQQAQLDFQKAKFDLSNFLWLENVQPVDANKLFIVPQEYILVPFSADLNIANNPKLLSYGFKISDLNIERRLKAESLKPELNIGIGVLNQGSTPLRNLNSNYWSENNKVNVGFSFPLTFAKARGDLAETKIKIRQTELDQDLVQTELQNKINQNVSEVIWLENQLIVLEQTLEASRRLLRGEEIKFRLGDSSLFLINSRETKLIEVNEKLLSIKAKIYKAKLKSIWLKGLLFQDLDTIK